MSQQTLSERETKDAQNAVKSDTKPNTKKLFIKTYGCQMNVYDSERMADVLAPVGYAPTDTPDGADLVVLNTCHIREKAAEKVYSNLGRLRKIKNARAETDRPMTIGVTGCVAQAEGREILRREKSVDLVVGPQTYHRLPEVVAKAMAEGPQVVTDYSVEDKFEHMPLARKKQVQARGVTAFLTVQEGCDKFRTFCVVPYTRGAEVSRPLMQIMTEARSLVDAGVREITLLGQNVNAWHGESASGIPIGLGELLHELAAVDGIQRLRYVTSHPNDMDDGLIAAHRDLPVLMPYLHLPVQAGSDRILKAMNRKHTAEKYLDVIRRVREARPDIAISGDFIVGFPGETDAEFEETLALVDAVRYSQAFSFKYSPRPGTPAAGMDGQIAREVMDERLQRLQSLLNRDQLAFNQASVGKTCEVLVERKGKLPGQWLGKTPWLTSAWFEGDASIGDMVTVELVEAGPNSLRAHLS